MMSKKRKRKRKIIKALSPPKSEKAWARWLTTGKNDGQWLKSGRNDG